jgi:GAF domain-containing protein
LLGTREAGSAHGAYQAPGSEKFSGKLSQSSMRVPIIVNDKAIGVVSVSNYKQNYFSENNLSLLQTLSTNMGVAIQNARLFEAEQERVAELAIINSVQEGLASKLEMQAIYDLVGDKIQEIFDAQSVFIAIYDPATDLVSFPYWMGSVENPRDRLYLPSEHPHGFSGQVIRTRQAIVINKDMERIANEIGSKSPVGGPFAKSAVYVPIQSGESVLGVISLLNIDRENAFSESDVRLLQTLANAMSVALQNAQSFKAEQERVAELAIINSVQEGLASKLDIQGIYDLVGDKLNEIFKSDILYIAVYHPEKNTTSFPYAIGRGKKGSLPDLEVGGFSGEAIRKRETIIVNEDVERRSAEVNSFDMSTGENGEPLSLVYVPIIAGENVLGVVSLQSFERGYVFPESDIRLLETLTNSMSVALQNAQSFKAEQERVAELQIINSIQQGLASKLEFQSIIDLVGEKVRETTKAQSVFIALYNKRTEIVS